MYAQDTRVPVAQSRAEIERLLETRKAKQYGTAVDYEKLEAQVQFRLHDRLIRFIIALPDPKAFGGRSGVQKHEQAERQRWRALLLVIKAKLESVESKIATFEEEFLAHIVMPNNQTIGKLIIPQIEPAYKSGKMRALALELGPAPEGTK